MGLAIAGLGLAAAGAAGSAFSANETQKGLKAASQTPFIDPNQVYSTSLGATTAALPGAEQLTSQENAYNTQQQQAALNAAIPGYGNIQSARSANILAELNGNLPPDVMAAIERSGAAAGLSGGFAGSQAGRNLTARDLGTTSLGLMNTGNQQAAQFISGTPFAAPASVASNLGINPATLFGADVSERAANQGVAVQAANSPGWAGALGGIGQTAGGYALGKGGGLSALG